MSNESDTGKQGPYQTTPSLKPPSVEPPYLEPWMRGSHAELDPLRRGVVHALELTREDAERKVGAMSTEQIFTRPFGLASVAFHMRHMARSLDRLLTYTEGRALDEAQLAALNTEHVEDETAEQVAAEFRQGLRRAIERVLAVTPDDYEEPRGIGRKQLPTTVGGLLVHCAEHTQRHAGQMVTTAKLVQQQGAEGTA